MLRLVHLYGAAWTISHCDYELSIQRGRESVLGQLFQGQHCSCVGHSPVPLYPRAQWPPALSDLCQVGRGGAPVLLLTRQDHQSVETHWCMLMTLSVVAFIAFSTQVYLMHSWPTRVCCVAHCKDTDTGWVTCTPCGGVLHFSFHVHISWWSSLVTLCLCPQVNTLALNTDYVIRTGGYDPSEGVRGAEEGRSGACALCVARELMQMCLCMWLCVRVCTYYICTYVCVCTSIG